MTPLRGFFKRLMGEDATPTNQPASGASRPASPGTSARDTRDDADSDDPTRKRRRGRRGGRNRNKSANGDTQQRDEGQRNDGQRDSRDERPTAQRSQRNDQRNDRDDGRSDSRGDSGRSDNRNGNRDQRGGRDSGGRDSGGRDSNYNWGRRVNTDEAVQRSRRANDRRRDVRSRSLDAPLPEDIAFRPGAAGGDETILPSRRRRPQGLHDTARILMGGARTAGAWVRREDDITDDPRLPRDEEVAEDSVRRPARDEEAPTAVAESTTDADDTDETDDDTADGDAPRKRRRGRRGGRNRNRSRDGEGTPEDTIDSDDSDDDDSDDDGDDEAPVVSRVSESARRDSSDDRDDEDERDERPQRDERPAVRRREAAPAARRAAHAASLPDEALPQAFAAMGVQRLTLEVLAGFGFSDPTPIQKEAIPALVNNLDVVGIAQTGSGKTVAFGIPMVEKLDPSMPEVQGIVMVPTRELAQQVLEVLTDLAAPWGLTTVGLLGGRSLRNDFKALEGRPHIVVGTPGRILDHLGRQTLTLRHVCFAVLDEADQMLDIGFLPDIRRILSRTPQRRQTALFSATMPGSIRRLIWQFMTDPETIRVDAESTTVDTVEQIFFEVAGRDKVRATRELIERELKGRTLIFCNMKRGVDHLARELDRDGVRVGALHGDMDQRRRDSVVRDFRDGSLDVLIATNVAARGLDIPEITHVVNYDVPQNLEEYVHRIGRTGRAGRDGKAITFVSEWDVESFDVIVKGVESQGEGDTVSIKREELDLYAPTASTSDAAQADPAS